MPVLGIPGQGYSSNAYVLSDGADGVLVDPGLPASSDAILAAVARTGLDIGAVVLTHRHYDHVGCAGDVAKGLGVPIFAPDAEAAPLREADSLTTGAFLFGSLMSPIVVDDISRAPLPRGWAVLATPGHTIGSVCLHNPTERRLVCGDTLFCDGGVGRWDLPTGSLEELKSSLRMVVSLGVAGLYPGHGRWVDSGGALHAELALESVRDAQ